MAREGMQHVTFVCQLYKKQIDGERSFLHEHPAHARSWGLWMIREILGKPGVVRVVGDQCAFGLWCSDVYLFTYLPVYLCTCLLIYLFTYLHLPSPFYLSLEWTGLDNHNTEKDRDRTHSTEVLASVSFQSVAALPRMKFQVAAYGVVEACCETPFHCFRVMRSCTRTSSPTLYQV